MSGILSNRNPVTDELPHPQFDPEAMFSGNETAEIFAQFIGEIIVRRGLEYARRLLLTDARNLINQKVSDNKRARNAILLGVVIESLAWIEKQSDTKV